MKHDDFCPCTRFQAAADFCNCEAGGYGNARDQDEVTSPLLQALAAGKTGWRRKKGLDRKPGYRRLEQWTPARAHKFATTRLNDIQALLQEISILYDDVDQVICSECDNVINAVLPELRTLVDSALEEGRSY